MFSLIRSPSVPAGTVQGFQNDGAGTVYAAIAHTQQGNIPGKAQGNNCWYPYGGKEHLTHDFSWIVAPGYSLKQAYESPAVGLATGHQTDGAGYLWAAIAHSMG